MNLQRGELVLVRLRFHQTAGAKIRPVVVLLDSDDDDFVAAPITSQLRNTQFDFAVKEWKAAGLIVPSFVRVHKLTVLPKTDVIRSLGCLTATDQETLLRVITSAFIR